MDKYAGNTKSQVPRRCFVLRLLSPRHATPCHLERDLEQLNKMESTGDKSAKSNETRVSDDDEEGSEEEFEALIEEKLDDTDESHENDKRRLHRSGVWEFFEVTDIDNKTATCNLCSETFSYRTTSSNLSKHLKRIHCVEFDKEVIVRKRSDSKSGPRVSAAWEYFIVKDREQRVATCKLCGAHFSYKTSVSNLMKHAQRIHGVVVKSSDDEEDNDVVEEVQFDDDHTRSNEKKRVNPSVAWNYFTKTDPERRIATCKLCNEERSYMSTVWNLMRHVRRKHKIETTSVSKDIDLTDNENVEELEWEENGHKKPRINPSAAWRYFTKTDPERRIATCKLCREDRSYSTVGNLLKHVRRKHNIETKILRDPDDIEAVQREAEMEDDNVDELEFRESHPSKGSPIWLYFKCFDRIRKKALCLICKKRLSFATSITNLKRHLYRKHPHVKLPEGNEPKKIIISSDGQLYEIEETTPTKQEKADDDEQPATLDIDSVFLDDFDGDITIGNTEKSKAQSKKTPPKQKTRRHLWREQVLHEDSQSGSDDEITFKKRYVRKKDDTLDKFGTYLISLLRQLPKELSNQLQMDFVKQVMTAHLTYESQKNVPVSVPNNGYAITISESQEPKTTNIEYMTVQENVVIEGE